MRVSLNSSSKTTSAKNRQTFRYNSQTHNAGQIVQFQNNSNAVHSYDQIRTNTQAPHTGITSIELNWVQRKFTYIQNKPYQLGRMMKLNHSQIEPVGMTMFDMECVIGNGLSFGRNISVARWLWSRKNMRQKNSNHHYSDGWRIHHYHSACRQCSTLHGTRHRTIRHKFHEKHNTKNDR